MKTEIFHWKHDKCWYLLDSDGYAIFSHSKPSVVRKARLYWFLYLTSKSENYKDYLDKIANLNGE